MTYLTNHDLSAQQLLKKKSVLTDQRYRRLEILGEELGEMGGKVLKETVVGCYDRDCHIRIH